MVNLAAVSDQNGEVYFDNPWLNLISLKSRIEGNWEMISLGIRGDLVLLNKWDIASAGGQANFKEKRLTAGLIAKTPIEGLPAFNGDMVLGQKEGMEMGAELTVVGLGIASRLKYDWNSTPHQVKVAGDAQIPIVGYAKMLGRAEMNWSEYGGEAAGVINLLFTRLGWKFSAWKNRGWKFEFIDPENRIYVFDGPRIETINREEIENRIKEAKELQNKNAPSAEAMSTMIQYVGDSAQTLQQQMQKEISNVDLPSIDHNQNKDKPKISIPCGKLEVELRGQNLHFFTKNPDREYLQAPIKFFGISSRKECIFGLWYSDSDDGKRALLIYDFEYKKIQVVECASANCTMDDQVRTDKINSDIPDDWGNLFEGSEDRMPELRLYFKTLFDYTKYKVWGPKPSKPFTITTSNKACGFKTEEYAYVFWLGSQQINRGVLPLEILPKNTNDEQKFCQKITSISPTYGDVFFDKIQNDCISVLEFAPGEIILFHPDIEKYPTKPVRLHWITDNPIVKEMLAYMMALQLRHKVELADTECYIGSEGGFLYDEQKFWAISANELIQSQYDKIHSTNWEQFINWPAPTSRFLPKELQEEAQRRGVKAKPDELAKLARYLVSPFTETRQIGWAAAPMGLIIGITDPEATGSVK
jgi:hypothetical protein